jgi:hypothetical protein
MNAWKIPGLAFAVMQNVEVELIGALGDAMLKPASR